MANKEAPTGLLTMPKCLGTNIREILYFQAIVQMESTI